MRAWARAGWRVWDLGNGAIMLQKLFNPEWQINSKSFLLSSFLIGFSFSPTAEISRLELEFEESLTRKTRVKEGIGQESNGAYIFVIQKDQVLRGTGNSKKLKYKY